MEAMARAISDDVLDEFAVYGDTWEQAVREVRERYADLLDRVGFYGTCDGLATDAELYEIARSFRGFQPNEARPSGPVEADTINARKPFA